MKKSIKLGELFEIGSGGTPSKKHPDYYDGDVPWVKTGDLKSEYLYEVEDYITDAGLKNSSARMYEPETVLIAMYGATIGATSILKFPACTNQACAAFKPNHLVRPEYLYYFLTSRKQKFIKDGVGGAQPNISASYLKKVDFNLIDVQEQDGIINVLSRVSAVIQSRKLEIEKLDELIKARFVEMFGDQGDNPLGFEVGTLKDVADIYLGLTHTPTYVESGKPFLSVRDISSGTIDFSNCHYITEEEFQSLPKGARPMTNDLLFCRVGTIGKPVIVPEGIPEFGSFVSVGYLRKKENVVNEYLKSWMEDPFFMKQVYDNVSGASQINLNTGWLKNFSILVPPLDLQKQFAAFVEQVDKSKVAIQKSLEETQLLFDSLMQEYFG